MSNYARAEMPAVYSYTEFTNYEFLLLICSRASALLFCFF